MTAPVTRTPSLEQPTWELVLRRNSIERMKQEKHPLDIIHELPDLIARGYEAIPEEDIVRLNWWGLTHDKPKVGTFMVRIKVPGGILTPAQARGLGELARQYSRDYAELTTRQGIQFHYVRLDRLPEVLEAIQRTGLTTVGGEGDTVRNITGCPLAGVLREEVFDVRPVIREAARFFYGNRDYSNLPRKHKVTISACPYQCNAPEIHDIALIGVVKEGRPGFAVRVGGGLSATPRLSRDLGVFVPVEEAVAVIRAITDVWQTNLRYRLSRAKARLKFLVDDYGPEAVRRMVEERLGHPLEDGRAPEPVGETDHLGITPQKQEGLYALGFPVPMGWVSGTQLIRIAEVAEAVGADIRFTRQQNFLLTHVPEDRLEWVREEMARLGFPLERNRIYGNSTACTSHRFCNYSVAETKEKLGEILEALERRFGREIEGLTLYMDGCPHSCAHHWVGALGLQGTTARGPEGRVEAYDVTLRGGLGRRAHIGRPILRRVPTDRITEAVVRLVGAWLEERARRGPAYSFQDFCLERSDEELVAIATGEARAEEGPARTVALRVPGPLLELSGGLDRIEVEAGTVRALLEAVGRQYPALRDRLLRGPDRVDPSVNLYVNEEDIRSLRGLDTPLKPGDEVVVLPAMAGG